MQERSSKTESDEVIFAQHASVNDLEHLFQMEGDSSSDPPFETTYKHLFEKMPVLDEKIYVAGEGELPLIDLKQLKVERDACRKQIAMASMEWGFFQLINHGIPEEVLQTLREEQIKLMKKSYVEKMAYKDVNFTEGSYRWGTRYATNLRQLNWSEAFHVSLDDILGTHDLNTLGCAMVRFVEGAYELSQRLAVLLAEEIGLKTDFVRQRCPPPTSYLRLNRYPPCPKYPQMLGISPHTDSDFLTILQQDTTIGGLQLMKDGKWIAVKPSPHALLINIGDLFQAWSNNVYKSVEHRVVVNAEKERYSTAYFFSPPNETVIESNVYRSFSYGEFRKQVAKDVKDHGYKIGLPNFLCSKQGV